MTHAKQILLRSLERLTGRRRLERIYDTVLDGLSICHFASVIRPDFKIL